MTKILDLNLFKKNKQVEQRDAEIDRFEDAMDVIKQWLIEGGELPEEIYLNKEN